MEALRYFIAQRGLQRACSSREEDDGASKFLDHVHGIPPPFRGDTLCKIRGKKSSGVAPKTGSGL